MRVALNIARLYVGVVGFAGFLFGQVFVGIFSGVGTVVGITSLLAAIIGGEHKSPTAVREGLVLLACGTGIVGVALDVYRYASEAQIPGDAYAWELVGPFLIALCVLAWGALVQYPRFRANAANGQRDQDQDRR